jgi:integrase
MRNVWIPKLGKYRLDQITRTHIKTILIKLQQEKSYSRSHMLSILTFIQSCLAEAVDEEIITQNPATRQTKNISKTDKKTMEVFLEPELKLLLQVALDYSTDFYVKVLVMARTGMREGEMLALQIEDLNFDKNQIWV